MKYLDIKTAALAYADRNNPEIDAMVDIFLPFVEARINRSLRTLNMAVRSRILMVADQIYYGLPTLFGGVRDVAIGDETGCYINPEQMNGLSGAVDGFYYTIIADQIQVYPARDGDVLEIVYYKRIEPLTVTNETNWVSDRYPDLYKNGLLVEIESYVKNMDAANLWNQAYNATIQEIEHEDSVDRWSGPSLTIKAG